MVNNMMVLRGGAWFYSRAGCRCAFRYRYLPIYRNDFVGFRLVGEMREKVAEELVLRGGSWTSSIILGLLRCSCRNINQPAIRGNDVGLRLAGEERRGKYDE